MLLLKTDQYEQIVTNIPREIGVTDEEGQCLSSLARNIKSGGTIVEIGSYKGRSSAFIASGMKPGCHLYCIDIWGNPKDRQVFDSNLDSLGLMAVITPIHGKSSEVVKDWGKPIDFLFIDGSHKMMNVKADYENWSKHVRPGGVIAFHDYGTTTWPDVKEFIDKTVQYQLKFYVIHGKVWAGRK